MSKQELSKGLWRESVLPLMIIGAVIFPFRSAIADWNTVPTASMNPTIVEGDRIFVNKLAYDLKVPFTTLHIAEWGNPARGDVIVFYAPDDGTRLVKRVVGLPGDELSMRGEQVFINGSPLAYGTVEMSDDAVYVQETLGSHQHKIKVLPNRVAMRDFGPQIVPEGQYFVMGDNRDNSRDSRYFGFVARSSIVGRATTVVVSFDPENFYLPRAHRLFVPMP